MEIDKFIGQIDLMHLAERAGADLKRAGPGWRGACPLHGGDDPTEFIIYGSQGQQRWRCLTRCGDGDALDFVNRWYHISPNGSQGLITGVRTLAEFEGLEDLAIGPEEAQQAQEQRERRERGRQLLDTAAGYYAAALQSPTGAECRDYALSRGWSEETIAAMGLGCSDGGLVSHLRGMGSDLDLAHEIGLLNRRECGDFYDAIPSGYLVYVHRIFDSVTHLRWREAFTDEQDRRLYIPHHSAQGPYWAIAREHGKPLIMVDDPACAITVWQWGYNAVAPCGAALDELDVEAIRGYLGLGVYVVLDPNEDKIGGLADRLGPLTMIVEDIPAADLNAWLTAAEPGTARELDQRLRAARPWIEVSIERASAAPPYQMAERLEHLARLVSQLSAVNRGRYIRQICTQRHLSTKSAFRALVAGYEQATSPQFSIQDGCLAEGGEPLGNWFAIITHETIHDDGMNEPEITYTLEGALEDGEPLAPVQLAAADFERMRWLGKCWGARPINHVSSPGQIRRAIQAVSLGRTKRERIYTATGWTEVDGQLAYLTTEGALSAAGLDPGVRVDLGVNNLNRYALPHPPLDPRPAIEASLGFLDLAPLQVTFPLWAAMYAAPLTPIRALNAVLWIYGATQSGKSSLSHLALTHFGPSFISEHDFCAPADWISTVTSLENVMFMARDIPVVLDDYAPASGLSEARQLARKAHRVIRSVGNRSARGRARTNLTERRQRPPRGLVIATAENPLVNESIVGRTIYVPVERGQVIKRGEDYSALDRAQQQGMDGLYARAMSGYVCWLAGRWEQLCEELPGHIRAASNLARVFPFGRLVDYYGLLIGATRLALEYADHHGALNDDPEALLEIYGEELIGLLRAQSRRVADASPTVRFWEAIGDLLVQESVYFAPRLGDPTLSRDRSKLIGWYDDDRVYLLTNAALMRVRRYWQNLGEHFDTRADALRRELWTEFGVRRDKRQYERVTYIRGEGRVRTLWLDAEAIWERTGIDPSGRESEPLPDEM